jgi:hypothetical protein
MKDEGQDRKLECDYAEARRLSNAGLIVGSSRPRVSVFPGRHILSALCLHPSTFLL